MSETLTQQETPAYSQMTEKLGSDGMSLLDDQLSTWAELNGRELDSPLRDALKTGDTTLPEGTLLHGMGMYGFDADAVKSVAEKGIVSGELLGVSEDAETHGCADFFRTAGTTSIGDYFAWAKETVETGRVRRQRGERLLTRGVAFIVDAQAEGVDQLLGNDGYRNEAMAGFVSPPSGRTAEDTSAILGGVPRGAIAGMVVGARLLDNPDVVATITENFPDTPLFDQTGTLLEVA